ISRLSSAEPSGASLVAVLEQVRGLFGMDTVALIDPAHEESPLASVGPPPAGSPSLTVEATDRLQLVGYGPEVFAQDRRLLGTLAAIASRAWQGQRLAEQAAQSRQLAETDRVRSALLAAVSHDLRTPLAGIKAAVSGLRQEDIAWTKEEQQDLLRTVEESTDRLTDLISNILAMSRIQAGAVSLQVSPVALDEVVARAMLSLPTVTEAASSADMDADTGTSPQADTGSAQSDSGTSPQGDTVTSAQADTETSAQADTSASIIVDVPEDLPLVLADAGLLERVVANLVDNARRFSPPGVPVRVHAEPPGATGTGPVDSAYSDDSRSTDSARSTDPSDCVRLHITDHGPGIPPSLRDRMFTPFQRLGDQDAGAGLGLGLAIAKGFTEAMHAELIPSVTPGGGLTMTIAIRTVTTEVAT
ncbi:MAG: two-component system, OmpR family, sensor histidine kinase KdpD, partial [Actinomycetota bacterium]|nr:two-component system, OmpR family, sensor histidine kinase KdpD [Actinomycetota bacterium]